jgi:hypothetical protein
MNAKISEKIKVDVEQMALTTVSQGSIAYDMQGYDRALFVASVFSSLGVSSQVVDLWETSAATVTGTTAAGGKAGVEIGSTVSTSIPVTRGCRELLVTLGTACTDLNPLTISYGTVNRTFVYTTSTALQLSSAWTTAALYFGSTVGSTVDTGLKLSAESLKAAIESTRGFGGVLQCSTPSTVQLVVKVASDATANLGFASTASGIAAGLAQRCVVGFDIAAEDLTSTAGKRYLGVNFAAGANAGQKSIVVLRSGARQGPPVFSGLMSS